MEEENLKFEILKEKISYYKDLLRNLTLLLIAIVGGTASLLFKLNNPVAVILVFPGIILSSGTIVSVFVILDVLRKLIKEMEQCQKK
ncbi:hypothetical protein SAMN06265339_0130 [Desulfurobacterium pacificum]|jgi:hypothetical protein|uniref:Uncharacterized protein n=1 Tax=Desulfurobacterium pacificum TaxID=240166 RepID=A0ABY1N8T9_9BACT|nr:hypothetical protein [Desulfurobacterium pacificum]SMP03587.1 hypothetical protein SAMN06265339_0130 [Desulfurobacterium pacificum]